MTVKIAVKIRAIVTVSCSPLLEFNFCSEIEAAPVIDQTK